MGVLGFLRGVRDYAVVVASGTFEHSLYARFNLGHSACAPFAALHYLLGGEAAGFRPCPFFDPAHYAKSRGRPAPGNLFAAFLGDGGVGAACREFDAAWYSARNPDGSAGFVSPWWHLQRVGVAALCDPSADLSLQFVLQAYNKRPAKLVRMLMELFKRRLGPGAKAAPLRLAELESAQDAFRAQVCLDVRAALAERRHANLVFVQTDGRHPATYEDGRDFDLMLNYYCDPSAAAARKSDYLLVQRGTKVTAIDAVLKRCPDLLLRYDRVLFLDDDVEFDSGAISVFFAAMAEHGLDLAQPALSADSATVFGLLKAVAGGPDVRRTTAVEIMAPALSRRALETCGWAFATTVGCFGVDLLLGAEVSRLFGATVAVVDTAVASHVRAADHGDGAFYRFLAANGIDPFVEMWSLLSRRGIPCEIRPL